MAGRIPQGFVDDLLARTDIVGVIDARVPLKRAGRNYTACCPFHKEKTPSFTVSQDKQFYYCFGCGATGNAVGFLMEYERRSFPEAVEELAARAGLTVPYEGGDDDGQATRNRVLYDLLQQADRHFQEQLRRHSLRERAVDYLKGRGLTGEIARRFGLGFAPPGWDHLLVALGGDDTRRAQLVEAGLLVAQDGKTYDRFRDRIMFPIRDLRGRVIGFGGRVIGDGKPKYLNSPETPVFHKGRELYGLYEAKQAAKAPERLVVVEGYMDVIALAQQGINNAVATLGTACTSDHVDLLFRHAGEVVFCFDGDAAGRRAAWRALEAALPKLTDGRSARFLFLPPEHDPDSLVRERGADAFNALLNAADSIDDVLLREYAGRVDLGRTDGRARLVAQVKPYLAQVPGEVLRSLMTQKLAELAQVDPRLLATTPAGAATPPAGHAPGHGAVDARPEPPDWPETPAADSYAEAASYADAYAADDRNHEPADGWAKPRGGRGSGGGGNRPGQGERRPWRRDEQRRDDRPRRPPPPPLTAAGHAVRRLLADPTLAQEVSLPEELRALGQPDVELLFEVVDILRASDYPSVPLLFGRLQGGAHYAAFAALAGREFLAADPATAEARDTLRRELADALRQLEIQGADAALHQEQQRPGGPDPERLRALLRRLAELRHPAL